MFLCPVSPAVLSLLCPVLRGDRAFYVRLLSGVYEKRHPFGCLESLYYIEKAT
nr:MAG TPA: hypothetical protein [Caudoviricetes sp.]